MSLPGCDPIYGIYAREIAHQPPDEACISSALRRTPGVVNVQEKTIINEGWLLVGDGPLHGTPVRYFTYSVGRKYAPTLMVEEFGNGRFEYSDTMLAMGKEIPRADMDYTLPIMRDAEKHVAQACGVHIDSGMVHYCDGSLCDPR